MMKKSYSLLAIVLSVVTAAGVAHALNSKTQPSTNAPGVPGAAEHWPMDLDTFLAGNYLERADIMLTRRNWDLTSTIIRWATESPFSHAALVFNRPKIGANLCV